MRLRYLLIAVAAAAGMAAPASAVVTIATYTGIVSSGTDHEGVFGSGPLIGSSFSAVFTHDSSVSPGTFESGPEFSSHSAIQRGQPGHMGIPVTGGLTINGITLSLGDYDGGVERDLIAGDYYAVRHNASNLAEGTTADEYFFSRFEMASFTNDFLGTLDLSAPLTYTRQAGDDGLGVLTAYRLFHSPLVQEDIVRLRFRVDTVTLAPQSASAVPEPATWAFMLLGFGFVGGAIRAARARRLSPATI